MLARRAFLGVLGGACAAAAGALAVGCRRRVTQQQEARPHRTHAAEAPVTLFLCGDLMTGRAIDQILPHPSAPGLHEPFVHDAREYLALAEHSSGDIPHPVDWPYVWGDALELLVRRRPHVRIANLETAVTRSDAWWRGKSIHYRMHPRNVPVLAAAGIDCCVLANNHVLDWGYAGLAETLRSLRNIGLHVAGAGDDAGEASRPAILPLPGDHRLLVFAAASADSGVPDAWAAKPQRAGVQLLPDLSQRTVETFAAEVRRHRQPRDRVLVSLHWGGNWGFDVAEAQRAFAHALIEVAGADVVHGHSSHHVKGIEVHRGRPILFGCGDFLDDYEGIGGYEAFRGELGAMYFVTLDAADGRLLALDLVPTRIRRFRIVHARGADRRWLLDTLQRECGRLGCAIRDAGRSGFSLAWDRSSGA